MVTWADISKAEKILGWKPEIDFTVGLEKMVTDYQENKNFYSTLDI